MARLVINSIVFSSKVATLRFTCRPPALLWRIATFFAQSQTVHARMASSTFGELALSTENPQFNTHFTFRRLQVRHAMTALSYLNFSISADMFYAMTKSAHV